MTIGHVAQDGWNVGFTQSSSHPLGYKARVLSVFRVVSHGPWKSIKGDHNGKVFLDDAEADRFNIEHGYTKRFYRYDYAMVRHTHRQELRLIHAAAINAIRGALTRESVINICSTYSSRVADVTGLVLARSHWFCGFHLAARRLRPELFVEREAA